MVYTKHPDGSISISSDVRVIDLVKVVNQLFVDKMEYVNISVTFSENPNKNGDVVIHAVSNATSDDVKKYPVIKANTMLDLDSLIVD